MKKLLFMIFSYLIVIFFLGSTNLVAQKKRQPRKITSSTKKISSLTIDQQAYQKAVEFWKSKLTKCGNDFYSEGLFDPSRDGTSSLRKPVTMIFQFKNPNFTLEKRSISSADKLNGLEFSGSSKLEVETSRFYSEQDVFYNKGGWSKWYDGLPIYMFSIVPADFSISLIKKDGYLGIHTYDWQSGFLKPIDCSKIPN